MDYPATRDFIKAVDGATGARARVEATAASCPTTAIVLGGYSQGAAVIELIAASEDGLLGFARPLPANVAKLHHSGPDVVADPHRRAADWGNEFNSGGLSTVAGWLDLTPDECVRQDPGLGAARAWIALSVGQLDDAAEWAEAVETGSPDVGGIGPSACAG